MELYLDDTWSWNGLEWIQEEDSGPEGRNGHKIVYDSVRDRVVLFGGKRLFGPGQLFRDTWTWDGEYWTQRQNIGPAPRFGHGMAYDSARQRTVLFGGMGANGLLGDTWEQFERSMPT